MELERQENVLVVGHQVGDVRLFEHDFQLIWFVTGYSPMSVRAVPFNLAVDAI